MGAVATGGKETELPVGRDRTNYLIQTRFIKYNTSGGSNILQILPASYRAGFKQMHYHFQENNIPFQIYSLTSKKMHFSLEKVYLILTAEIVQLMLTSNDAISLKKCALIVI
jgi:hypothetical protein